ncbi:MAG: lipoprotein [Pseudomonadota bacterium]
MTQRKLSIALFTILAFFLGGCGQKGALYLPRTSEPPEPIEEPVEEENESDSENNNDSV